MEHSCFTYKIINYFGLCSLRAKYWKKKNSKNSRPNLVMQKNGCKNGAKKWISLEWLSMLICISIILICIFLNNLFIVMISMNYFHLLQETFTWKEKNKHLNVFSLFLYILFHIFGWKFVLILYWQQEILQ